MRVAPKGTPVCYVRGGKRHKGTVYADPVAGSLIVRDAKGRLFAVSRDRAAYGGHVGSMVR